jgi:hypothetical protein
VAIGSPLTVKLQPFIVRGNISFYHILSCIHKCKANTRRKYTSSACREIMPPLVFCAASSVLSGDSHSDERRHRNGSRSDICRRSSPELNPLMARFLLQQRELCSSIPCLREDLQSLRRVGNREQYPDLHTTCIKNYELAVPQTRSSLDQPRSYSAIPRFAEVPGMSFANVVWAKSAIRRMRIEAMYI